jgi:hypothetical protein
MTLSLLKTLNILKEPNSISTRTFKITQREYFLHYGYGYSAIIFSERGRQKKKLVALKEERLKTRSLFLTENITCRGGGGKWVASYGSSDILLFLLNARKT